MVIPRVSSAFSPKKIAQLQEEVRTTGRDKN
jgi:hypothetical protein